MLRKLGLCSLSNFILSEETIQTSYRGLKPGLSWAVLWSRHFFASGALCATRDMAHELLAEVN